MPFDAKVHVTPSVRVWSCQPAPEPLPSSLVPELHSGRLPGECSDPGLPMFPRTLRLGREEHRCRSPEKVGSYFCLSLAGGAGPTSLTENDFGLPSISGGTLRTPPSGAEAAPGASSTGMRAVSRSLGLRNRLQTCSRGDYAPSGATPPPSGE